MTSPEPAPALAAASYPGRRYQPAERFTVLVVDPDPAAAAAIAAVMDSSVIEVMGTVDAADALFLAGRRSPDLILVSAALQDLSPCQFITAVRRHDDVPVVIGIAPGETELAGPALYAGAAGVVTRPCRETEVRTLIDRHLPDLDSRRLQLARVTVGDVELDAPAMSVRVRGRSVTLTLREFELLRLLMLNAGRVVSHAEIREQVWGVRGEDVAARTVSVHVYRLRRYLGGAADLVGVRGIGYRITPRTPERVER